MIKSNDATNKRAQGEVSATESSTTWRESLRESARHSEHEQQFYVRTLSKVFQPGICWLDAGCGRTLIQKWIRNADEIEHSFIRDARMVVGADVDYPSLSESPILRIACDLSSLAFQSESFDLITCNMVVEHLAEPQRVFFEFFRILRPGGKVVILTPNLYHIANIVSRFSPLWFHKWVLEKLSERPDEDIFPTLYHCNTERALRNSLQEVGFSRPTVHLVPGRQRLLDFGPLFYMEYVFYQFSLRFGQLREILCAIAQKPGLADAPISRGAREPEG
jgi:2-polyprenyl-3-methyl-5-hydroxy-6-metoxy-1,4-benzoquinol methylase